jgi:SAM-dependent methyltransferase
VALTRVEVDARRCPGCGENYFCRGGIWRLLAPGRWEAFREFVTRYETVRVGEGRRVEDPVRLRALPFRAPSWKRRTEWAMRSQSYRALLHHVVAPLELSRCGELRVLDLGSGLGWLAYRLALRGHRVAAVDLVTNDFDGLGVHRRYDREFLPVQAEFDRLPFAAAGVDLVIYNAAFHYAADFVTTLREAMRVLSPGGRVVVMDSPLYRTAASGHAMVRERDASFEKNYGFRGSPTRGFVTYAELAALEGALALRWELFEPWYGIRWWVKPWVARLRRHREPARFKLLVGRRADDG